MERKPSGLKRWLNVYVNYEEAGRGPANLVALAGGPWGFCENADVNLPYLDGTGNDHAYAANMFAFFESNVVAVQ